MQKSFVNFLYWILVKSAESYYGDSMKEDPYIPIYFWKILFIRVKEVNYDLQ